MTPNNAIEEIKKEIESAQSKYPALHSNHEAYAVILEEMDELWDEIKKSKDVKGNGRIKSELIQVGAMVLRYLNDLC